MPYQNVHAVKAKPHFFDTEIPFSSLTRSDPPGQTAEFTGTKLVATIGPACQDVASLQAMLLKGVSAMRVDLTWGALEFHKKTLNNLQTAMLAARRMAASIVDTNGREITIRRRHQLDANNWPIHGETVDVEVGQTVILTTRVLEDPTLINGQLYLSVCYDKFPRQVQLRDHIWISRYLSGGGDTPTSLYLEVVDITDTEVVCTAQNNARMEGLLTVFHSERSDHGLENIQNDLPVLSDHDKACLKELGSKFEIDFISLSYTRTTQDVLAARHFLDEIGMTSTRILAKIEVRQALFNFGGILNASDGVILSRGNLGLDCLPEKMALLQKASIQACNLVGKPVLVTRFMDSMCHNPRPTRAEVTDVANAVLDGADCILVGAETVRGSFPLETVETISQIARQAEKVFDYRQHYDHLMQMALDIQQLDECIMDATSDDDGGSEHVPSLSIGFGGPGMPRHVRFNSSGSQLAAAGTEADVPDHGEDDDHDVATSSWTERLHLHDTNRSKSLGNLSQAIQAMNINQPGAHSAGLPPLGPPRLHRLSHSGGIQQPSPPGSTHSVTLGSYQTPHRPYTGLPYLSKMESIASSAVRVAEKVRARLIMVFTHTTSIAQLLSKYRPPMPILTLIVPNLVSDGLTWKLEGRAHARQCLLIRNVLPLLAAPTPGTDLLLDEAVATAARMGLVLPQDYLVCVERLSDEFCVKVVAVDDQGQGVRRHSGGFRPGERGGCFRQRVRQRLSVQPPNPSFSPPAMGVASTRPITSFPASTITPRGSLLVGTAPWLEPDFEETYENNEGEDGDMSQDMPRPLIHTLSTLANRPVARSLGGAAGSGRLTQGRLSSVFASTPGRQDGFAAGRHDGYMMARPDGYMGEQQDGTNGSGEGSPQYGNGIAEVITPQRPGVSPAAMGQDGFWLLGGGHGAGGARAVHENDKKEDAGVLSQHGSN